MAPFFGFLAAMAAPLLKPALNMAWQGVKSIGKDLFTQAKDKGVQLAKDTVSTLGTSIQGKLETIGSGGLKSVPQIEENKLTDNQELNNKMKILKQQSAIIPTIESFSHPNDLSYIQQNGMYKNQYPSFTNPNSLKQNKRVTAPQYAFGSKIGTVRNSMNQIDNRFQNDVTFNVENRMTNQSDFKEALQQQEQREQQASNNFRSEFERDDNEDYGDSVYKKFKF